MTFSTMLFAVTMQDMFAVGSQTVDPSPRQQRATQATLGGRCQKEWKICMPRLHFYVNSETTGTSTNLPPIPRKFPVAPSDHNDFGYRYSLEEPLICFHGEVPCFKPVRSTRNGTRTTTHESPGLDTREPCANLSRQTN